MGQEDRITLLNQIKNLKNNRWRFEANNDWEKTLYQKMDALDRGVDATGYGLAGGLVAKALRPITAGSLGAAGLTPSINPGLNARLTPAPPSAPGNLSTLQGSTPGTSRASPSNPFSQQQLAKAARDLLDPNLYERDEDLEAEFGTEKAPEGDSKNDPSLELVRVGRWMKPIEYEKMMESGEVILSKSGTTHITWPPNRWDFKDYSKGDFFVTFDVERVRVTRTSSGNVSKIITSNKPDAVILKKKHGITINEGIPKFYNIKIEEIAK